MSKLSRRGFLGAAGAAGVAAVAATTIDTGDDTLPPGASGTGPIVARVRDAASGEVTVYAGTREVTRKDRALVAAIARAASAR